MATLDAAKRKTLPTWIRLGLEKMEREKQRQAEHEERERLRLLQQSEQQAAVQELLADGAVNVVLGKSKFVSVLPSFTPISLLYQLMFWHFTG